jgi:GDPmannose 4,6-dehydratase
MKTALITGVTGQDGSYLAEFLLEKNYKVYGLNRRKALAGLDHISSLLNNKDFEIVEGDLLEESRLDQLVRDLKPDEIYNLASQSFVPYSWTNPTYTCNVNALGVVRLLEAIRIYSPDSRFYQASSSEIYGRVQETPQRETTYHYPRSPYGCSKSFGFYIVKNYRESYNLFATNGILFNHESERRGLQFVTRKITHSVAKIKLGLIESFALGNLDAKRDWGYSPDYVKAMWMIMQHNLPDDFVIATGESHSIREFVEEAFKCVDIDILWEGEGLDEVGSSDGRNLVNVSEKFYRPAEVEMLKGDPSKAKKILGWTPETNLKEMIKKMMDYDLSVLEKQISSDLVFL